MHRAQSVWNEINLQLKLFPILVKLVVAGITLMARNQGREANKPKIT